jgi:2,3,4,5-tetrahydropyridine-2,6-dicarboxylate N-succinyltransferase
VTATINSADDFKALVARVEGQDGYHRPLAFAFGVATTSGDRIVDTRFLVVNHEESFGTAAVVADHFGPLETGHRALSAHDLDALLGRLAPYQDEPGHPNVDALERLRAVYPREHGFPGHGYQPVVAVIASADDPPMSAVDAYLRLHLLSMRRMPPRSLNLDGMFGKLNTNVWTTEGVVDQACFDELQAQRTLEGRPLVVLIQDKFPRMLDYVSPSGVRILNPNNVRLGAHLADGTVVMTAGAINFNAGTLGEAMIEGRISAGVIVGARSDVGGGASLMGTLSGGNDVTVSLGEDCLIEATAGLGIPVGDRVRVQVGFYVVSTMPILVAESEQWDDNPVASPHIGRTVKAIELAGISDVIFRRNAFTGVPEVVPRGNRIWGKLNPELHKN